MFRLQRLARQAACHRSGKASSTILTLLAVLGLGIAGVWRLVPSTVGSLDAGVLVTVPVKVAPFVHEINERAEVESSSNYEVRCEVESRNSGGTAILEIVPEGKFVAEGEIVVRLDDSALRTELIQQQITCNNSQAMVIEAQSAVESAKLALEEYSSGTFRQEEQQIESEVFVAQENLRRAEEYLRYSRQLAERGYISEVQLEADAFAVEKARKELEVARTKLDVLRRYSRQKSITLFEAAVEATQARLRSNQKTFDLDQARSKQIEDQVAKCLLRASAPGQVVYANDARRRSASGEVLIDEGLPVRERQVILRLPDPKRMKVVARVHESRIERIQVGMPARMTIDAMPGLELSGKVIQISEFPLPSNWVYTAHIKEYTADIEINDPPTGLRSGMTAKVRILVEERPACLQVPLQVVLERTGKHYCVVAHGAGDLEAREVQLGPSNESFVLVETGLAVDEQVVMNPQAYLDRLHLPGVTPTAEEAGDDRSIVKAAVP